jgi:polyhydroxyalkanoate synthesis regulator phasin
MSSPDILNFLRRMEDSLADRFTTEMDRRFSEMRLEMNGRFDALEARLDRLETEYQMIAAALRRIEERLDAQGVDHERTKAEVADLKARVALLSERVQALEAKLQH